MGYRLAPVDFFEKQHTGWGAWLVQSTEHVTLGLGVVSLSPMMGMLIT